MKPVAFAYYRPQSLAEAVRMLREHPGSKPIAGGQSLIPLLNFRMARPEALVDLNRIPGLDGVEVRGARLRLGGLLRHQQLHEHPLVRQHWPVLAEAAGEVGHWAIRNRGTLGGSLAHADPAAELPAVMVAADAVFELVSADGVREMPAREFFYGYLMTALQPDEVLAAVELPLANDVAWGFAEVARRPGDFALAGAVCELRPDGSGAVTWFAVGGGPERHELTFAADAAARAAQWQDLAATLDAQDEYRRHLATVVAETAYQRACGRDGQ
ncbi:MAG: FAD binding domain-containing protein [Alicyclobacillus sp.]|nr:FAD binding domain-containing protein [Alicyclobacillus sp.]